MSMSTNNSAIVQKMQAFGLNETDVKKVAKCASRYSKPDSFLKKVSWVAYRAFNAIKSIFGQSDWQVAKRKLSRSFTMALPKKISQQLPVKQATKFTNKLANITLEAMVKINEGKVNDYQLSQMINPQEMLSSIA